MLLYHQPSYYEVYCRFKIMWKDAAMAYLKGLLQHLLGGTEENH
jgi:hypothetical protein